MTATATSHPSPDPRPMTVTRHDAADDRPNLWARLAAPLPSSAIQWRQDGRPNQRDGRFYARFVCYVEAGFVRERLDSVVPGEWELDLTPLPIVPLADPDGNAQAQVAIRATLSVLGVKRQDVGQGGDWKAAATDAFKRAAVRFGIAHELYATEQNWVQVDGDGRYAKPLEDPGAAYAKRYGPIGTPRPAAPDGQNGTTAPSAPQDTPAGAGQPPAPPRASAPASGAPSAEPEPGCPKCGGRMWDNRLTKRNPKAPDYKCRTRSCEGAVWPAKPGEERRVPEPRSSAPASDPTGGVQPPPHGDADFEDFPGALADDDDDLPF